MDKERYLAVIAQARSNMEKDDPTEYDATIVALADQSIVNYNEMEEMKKRLASYYHRIEILKATLLKSWVGTTKVSDELLMRVVSGEH